MTGRDDTSKLVLIEIIPQFKSLPRATNINLGYFRNRTFEFRLCILSFLEPLEMTGRDDPSKLVLIEIIPQFKSPSRATNINLRYFRNRTSEIRPPFKSNYHKSFESPFVLFELFVFRCFTSEFRPPLNYFKAFNAFLKLTFSSMIAASASTLTRSCDMVSR